MRISFWKCLECYRIANPLIFAQNEKSRPRQEHCRRSQVRYIFLSLFRAGTSSQDLSCAWRIPASFSAFFRAETDAFRFTPSQLRPTPLSRCSALFRVSYCKKINSYTILPARRVTGELQNDKTRRTFGSASTSNLSFARSRHTRSSYRRSSRYRSAACRATRRSLQPLPFYSSTIQRLPVLRSRRARSDNRGAQLAIDVLKRAGKVVDVVAEVRPHGVEVLAGVAWSRRASARLNPELIVALLKLLQRRPSEHRTRPLPQFDGGEDRFVSRLEFLGRDETAKAGRCRRAGGTCRVWLS